MKAMFLIPGTGDFHCGSCLRDHTLMRGLLAEGCQVVAVPMYLPWVTDGPGDGGESQAGDILESPVFFGGINTFLDATTRWSAYLPRRLRRTLDTPMLLRWTARFSHMTKARDVGRLSVSMIEHAGQTHGHEIARLARFAEDVGLPDVLCLSNSMLIGVGIELGRLLERPVICSLQGEDGFIDQLPPPYAEQTWRAISSRVPQTARLVAPSRWYAASMSERLKCDPSHIATIYNGVTPVEPASNEPAPPGPPTIGYLARMHPAKGLDRLIDAWIALADRDLPAEARLIIAGAMTRSDRQYVDEQRAKAAAAGLDKTIEWRANVSHADKHQILSRLSALCVPTTIPEAFGLFVIEAWSHAVPVIVPQIGALPELCAIGGGRLYDPDHPAALVDGLAEALHQPQPLQQLGQRGRQAVGHEFSERRMAQQFAALLEEAAAAPAPGPQPPVNDRSDVNE